MLNCFKGGKVMNIFKSKLLWLAPIAAILILVIFSLAFYPAFNPKPKDLPIAIVNNDEGTTIQSNKVDIGKKIEDKLYHLNVNHMTIQLETDKHKHEEYTLCTSVQHSH